jgi:hypothetical protein
MAHRGKWRGISDLHLHRVWGNAAALGCGRLKKEIGMTGEKNVGISAEVLAQVAEIARAEGKTADQVIEEAVRQVLKTRGAGRKRADFSELVGKWQPDPAFDEIIASQRQIDPEKWT